ncbi:hypothetical protein GCM10010517_77600 [Streptosporangium fragile]|uniref:Uncharacterized protein n=1 Tax=Streptosporangium fragile TaxID=46186 RepID=A0ABP6IVK1_9ACTN
MTALRSDKGSHRARHLTHDVSASPLRPRGRTYALCPEVLRPDAPTTGLRSEGAREGAPVTGLRSAGAKRTRDEGRSRIRAPEPRRAASPANTAQLSYSGAM